MARQKIRVEKQGVLERFQAFNDRGIFTAAETAAVLGVSERSIQNMTKDKRITPTKLGNRFFYTKEQILETACVE